MIVRCRFQRSAYNMLAKGAAKKAGHSAWKRSAPAGTGCGPTGRRASPMATCCIQVPIREMPWLKKKSRKLRWLRAGSTLFSSAPLPPHRPQQARKVLGESWPSHSGEAAIRGAIRPAGRQPRQVAGQGRPTRRIRPSFSRWFPSARRWTGAEPCRPANVSPGQVITGTPIQTPPGGQSAAIGKRIQSQIGFAGTCQSCGMVRLAQDCTRSGSIPWAESFPPGGGEPRDCQSPVFEYKPRAGSRLRFRAETSRPAE